jgi:hypothetical protein
LTLQVHGGIYLLLGLASSGALREVASLLLGAASWPGERQVALWIGLAAAMAAYWLSGDRSQESRASKSAQLFRVSIAASLVWLAAGIAAGILTAACHAAMGAAASDAYCATLRTAVLAGLGMLLAWAGGHWNRAELSRLVYPAMILGGYRLVMEDLHQGHTGALFFSLLLYGAVLTMLPRMKSWKRA